MSMKSSTMMAKFNCRILPLFLLVLMALAGCSETKKKQGPLAPAKPVFEATDVDLGTVNIEDGEKVIEYTVHNDGEKYFWIIDVVASCECTRTEFDSQEVKDGEQTTVKLILDLGKLDPGPFERDANVYTNLSKQPITLYLMGVAKHK